MVLQSYLRRTESDCRELAYEGSRVRLCKGAYNEPDTVAFRSTRDVDKSYVRCLKVLMSGAGYPMIATHDPRLIDIAGALAVQHDRAQGTYEYQMLYGVRPEAAPARGVRRDHAGLRAVRRGLVRLPRPPPRRASRKRAVLPARPGHAIMSPAHGTRVAILGAGKMGEVLLSGLLRAGKPAVELLVTTRRRDRADQLRERYGVEVVDNAEAAKTADVLVLAVKPQDMPALLDGLADVVPADRLVVSIAAGIPTAFIERRLAPSIPVVRVMTNTPALVDQAMSAVSGGSHASAADLERTEELLRRSARCYAYRITAGRGDGPVRLRPAYFYYLVEAMIDAGILLGLPRAAAADLIVTAIGAAGCCATVGSIR